MIWREKRYLLIVLGVLLIANTVFFFTYRVQYVQRLEELDARKTESQRHLDQARTARIAAEQQYASYRRIQRDVQTVYTETWSTLAERFTALINELKRVEAASQMTPRANSFSRTEVKGVSASSVAEASAVGISFNVQGNYQQARRLINLLELSPQFVIIDQISLASSGNDQLTLDIRLKTLFREVPANAAPVNATPPPSAPAPVGKEM
ncbi:MAG TPA: hypothetical protein VEZ11_09550 [Thermoanaerobaculia bacterium]|nr:hypothetical protein [Thermoanaerobaculia bacterium]